MVKVAKRLAVILLFLGAAAAVPVTSYGFDSCGCPADMGVGTCCQCNTDCSGGSCVSTCDACVSGPSMCS